MDPILVHLAAGRGYIWRAADVKLLRERCRFIGALIGPNTGNTHQEHLPHSLPLLLMPEELQLGLKRGWFLVVPDPLPLAVMSQAPVSTPAPEDLEKQSEEQDLIELGPTAELVGPVVDGAEGQQRDSMGAIATAESSSNTLCEQDGDGETGNRETTAGGPFGTAGAADSAAERDAGDTVSDGDAGASQSRAVTEPSAQAVQPAKKKKGSREEEYWLSFADATQKNVLTKSPKSGDAAIPGTPAPPHEESDRYVVYEDMYNRGYTITSGTNFGGNFLAYAGDPMDYHSEFVVRVLSKASRIPYPSLSAASRVALTARKKFLIALVTRKNDNSQGSSRDVQYIVIAPDLVTASGVSRGLRALPSPAPRKKS